MNQFTGEDLRLWRSDAETYKHAIRAPQLIVKSDQILAVTTYDEEGNGTEKAFNREN
jgi:hypothetical protein